MRYLRDRECNFCVRPAPLLLPVRFFCAYGGDEVYEVMLCAGCRVGWRDDGDACLASTVAHERGGR